MDFDEKAELDRQADRWAEILFEVKAVAGAMFADPEMQAAWLRGEAGVMVSIHGVRAVRKSEDEDFAGGMYL